MRQTLEQTFDIIENDTDTLALRTHSVESLQGHLMISFIATIALITIKNILKKRKKLTTIPPIQALKTMRTIKAIVYGDQLTMSEAPKEANLIIKELKLNFPQTLFIGTKKPARHSL
jgi:hypothetical protein